MLPSRRHKGHRHTDRAKTYARAEGKSAAKG